MPPRTSTLPRLGHTHDQQHDGITAHCPACMASGRINPDTGTPWPSLDEHGETVVSEAAARFYDRYDGPGTEESSLEVVAREAYLRGRMQGCGEERRDAALMRDASLRNAADALEKAAAAARAGDVSAAGASASNAEWHISGAAIYNVVAGSER